MDKEKLKTLKTLLNEYREAENKAIMAEDAYVKDSRNEILGRKFTNAYKEKTLKYIALKNIIIEISNGKIKEDAASEMIDIKPDKIEEIVSNFV